MLKKKSKKKSGREVAAKLFMRGDAGVLAHACDAAATAGAGRRRAACGCESSCASTELGCPHSQGCRIGCGGQ